MSKSASKLPSVVWRGGGDASSVKSMTCLGAGVWCRRVSSRSFLVRSWTRLWYLPVSRLFRSITWAMMRGEGAMISRRVRLHERYIFIRRSRLRVKLMAALTESMSENSPFVERTK